MMHQHNYNEHWQNLTEDFAKTMIGGVQKFHPSRKIAKELILKIGGKIIECGLGSGVDAEKLIKNLCYTGIDISPAIIKNLNEKFLNCNIHIGDISKIPYPENTFNTAYTRHVLEHLPKKLISNSINELVRVAKQQVIICLHIKPNKDQTTGRWLTSEKWQWKNSGVWEHHISLNDATSILNIKFCNVQVSYIEHKALGDNWIIKANNETTSKTTQINQST